MEKEAEYMVFIASVTFMYIIIIFQNMRNLEQFKNYIRPPTCLVAPRFHQ